MTVVKWLDNQGLIAGSKWDFSVCHNDQSRSGTQSFFYSLGTKGYSLGVKQPEYAANNSPPPSSKT
jgi:hypothetical protein